ncbi:hypothetical protein XAC3218_140025 [Xanthomonas citri pv. citri]|uniref:Uncharacterized protein n=1 Tax=Xanthomonas citri pv. citri TaxID=611301 RepID=A0A0U5FBA9_XANCI|nr:hypothetical protein XAC2911_110240 [Xanthomonas citri pv. citri]CEE78100.1 hypothetical protein XAC3218_140025 [Xanthomonas citri pv. citri]CEF43520.1 hypothetical protein XAC217_120013 [Xanthomonas citri pv. citri]CEG14207.1 hypothetical protein XAC3562_100044 [Xanthomonas citri pv. citri]CEH36493.1 hypothetical protein XACJK48_1090003 [Xanthomonas citri pv. citri]
MYRLVVADGTAARHVGRAAPARQRRTSQPSRLGEEWPERLAHTHVIACAVTDACCTDARASREILSH